MSYERYYPKWETGEAGGTPITPEALNRMEEGIEAANKNLLPDPQTANSATFLRNDNTWQKVTPANIGAVPTSRTVNSKALSGNITLSASDVGAVPTTRTVNGKALSSNVSLTASDVGALPTSGGRINGDVYLGGEDSTDAYDLYIRRSVDGAYKSARLYWNGGAFQVNAASGGTTFNSLQLRTDETVVGKGLNITTGVSLFNGDVRLGSDDNTTTHDLYLYRKLGDAPRNARLTINENGYLRLNYSDPVANTVLNSLSLYEDRTTLGKPLALASGGTGATTAEAARENLGIENLKTYDFTESTATNPLTILQNNFASLTSGTLALIRCMNGTKYCALFGVKTDSNDGVFVAATQTGGLYVIRYNNGAWTEKVSTAW